MTEQTLSSSSADDAEPQTHPASTAVGRPAWVAIAYAVFGLAWISYSDSLLLALAPDMASLASFGRLKGMGFVLFTGLLLYRLLLRRDRHSSQLQDAAQAQRQRAAWRLLEAIAESSTDAIYAKDAQGRYLFVNREAARLLGASVAQLLGKTAAHLLPAEQAERLATEDHAALLAERPISIEATLNTADGERIYLSTKGALRDSGGNTLGVFGVSRDITARRGDEARWRQWAMAFENIRDGVMITDAQCRIQTVNAAFAAITGYSAEDAVGATPRLLQSGRHPPEFYRQMWITLLEDGRWQGEIWNRRKNGEVFPEWLTLNVVRDGAGQVTNYVGAFTDVTGSKTVEAQLERLAHYDPLTDLPNRVLLQARLEQALLRSQRHGAITAVMVIDLDGFKTVNDSLGHPAGDELLVCVAARLQARLRADDLLGRLGGDEFLVVLEGCGPPADVAALARDLLAALAAPVPLACGKDAYVTASIGISLHPVDGSVGVVELLRDADAAMYRAKEQGRNRFCFYTSNMNAEAVAKLEVEAALSRALARGELLLHYQPKVDAGSGRVAGAEALLRWDRNGDGLVPPGQFIPVAEQSSLILDIGAWVIDEACRQIRAWMDAGQPLVRVAVNVAARQFAAGDLDQVVAGALQRHGVDAKWLEIEITEGMLITDPAAAISMLQRIKALGVTLSLDDFGTGYSSLAYLQHLPLDTLKIDQSFTRRIGEQPDGAALVDAVIVLAHRLHLRVVAEGVETAQQCDYLQRQGCDEMQGYHFGRPAPADSLQQQLAADASAVPVR
ncbi:MAG: EAL domain-containing protein [Burkholderiales bacterium]|jgi:diguanylate cyclase (GGDEF)-like protein/PAS domain S-box-containing protein|nr:EAL domain-containing protein [Burkholderiales bacterium]